MTPDQERKIQRAVIEEAHLRAERCSDALPASMLANTLWLLDLARACAEEFCAANEALRPWFDLYANAFVDHIIEGRAAQHIDQLRKRSAHDGK